MTQRESGIRAIAVDWSGARRNAGKKIWLAEVTSDGLVRLESGRDRDELVRHLAEEARTGPRLVVGLDFAFSFPAWFLRDHRCFSAFDMWSLTEREGESWLVSCPVPFWGRRGSRRPRNHELFRRTEREAQRFNNISPKSVFQVGGAGAVGTGSLRGMPLLLKLQEAGYSIWPFDPPGWPRVVEIYPRLLTGAVQKNDGVERRKYLTSRYSSISGHWLERAASNEDAVDAFVSAFVMLEHAGELASLPQAEDEETNLEGTIWRPVGSDSTNRRIT